MDIRDWLANIGMTRYVDSFVENDISVDLLPDLDHDVLKELGVATLGDRMRLLKAIRAQSLVTSSSAAPDSEMSVAQPAGESPPVPSTPTLIPGSEPGDSARPQRQAERRQLTVMFCDLANSTLLSSTLDPEDLRTLLHNYQRCCQQVIEKYSGHIEQYLGDGIMVYFGWPVANENDGEAAVLAAMDIVSEVNRLPGAQQLQVHIGIATGTVVVGRENTQDKSLPGNAVGQTPNIAARLEGLAAPGEILVSETTARLTRGQVVLEKQGEMTLKGVIDPQTIYRVVQAKENPSRFEADHAEAVLGMVGREDELNLILRRWELAAQGEGQVVVLSGEAGIGKSRVVHSVREAVTGPDSIELGYHASPYHSDIALYPITAQITAAAALDDCASDLDRYQALTDLLRRAGPGGIDAAPFVANLLQLSDAVYPRPDLTPAALREKTLEALIAQPLELSRQKPVLVIFEDVHWVDATTRAMLDNLVPMLSDKRIMLLVTHRPEYDIDWQAHGNVTATTLSRLGSGNIQQVILNITGGKTLPEPVVAEILAKTDGVPLFVEELTKDTLESGLLLEQADRYTLKADFTHLAIPATLNDSLMARLDRLSSARELAQYGAAIGREFEYNLIKSLISGPEPELEADLAQLIGSGLIVQRGVGQTGRRFMFKHALVQDATYNSMIRERRANVHREIAAVLESQHSQDLVGLARHWQQAGELEQAARYYAQACNDAFNIGVAPEEGLALGLNAVRALELEISLDEERVGELIMQASAELQRALGDTQIADLIDAPIDPDAEHLAQRLLLDIGPTAHQSSRTDLFALLMINAMVLTVKSPHGRFSAEVYAMYAAVHLGMTGDARTAYEWCKLAISLFTKVRPFSEARAYFCCLWFVHHWIGPVSQSIEYARAAIASDKPEGELIFINNSRAAEVAFTVAQGVPVAEAMNLTRNHIKQASDGAAFNSMWHMRCDLQYLKAMAGLTEQTGSLGDAEYSAEDIASIVDSGFWNQVGWYYVVRMKLAVHFGEFSQALEWEAKARELLPAYAGQIIQIDLEVFGAIAKFRNELQLHGPDADMSKLQANVEQLQQWRSGYEEGFGARAECVSAMMVTDPEQRLAAMTTAIQSHHCLPEQALMYEALADAAKVAGELGLVAGHRAKAQEIYTQIGYIGKVRYLRETSTQP